MYKRINTLIPEKECKELVVTLKNHYTPEDDQSVIGSKVYYNLPEFGILLGSLCSKISKLTKKNLKPTYGFCRIYYKDTELKPHKDKPSCEYSLTINLHQTHEWPIYFGKKQFVLGVGDAAFYMGCEVEHYRKKFEGDEYIQLFLHYVDGDGPLKEYALVPQIPTLFTFNFVKTNPHIADYLEIDNGFSVDECNFLLNQNFQMNPGRVGKDLGVLNPVRNSQVYWIPKMYQWKGLFEKLMGMIEQCNREYFKFDITSMTENLQYTEYSSEYQGYYDYHLDIGSGFESSRKLSISVQLSDEADYEGGELEFLIGCDKKHASKKQGTVIIFPSYLLHKVNPVTKGKRCSLVTWVAGPPFR
jgi:PKHD-type hydroxylase